MAEVAVQRQQPSPPTVAPQPAAAAALTDDVLLHSYEHLENHVAIQVAARMGDVRHLRKLIRQGVSVEPANRHGWRPLHGASANGRVDCVKALIEAKAIVDVVDIYGWTPLHDACSRGEFSCAQQLLQAGADVNKKDLAGSTPLDLAKASRHEDIVKLIVGDKETAAPKKKAPSQQQQRKRSRPQSAST